MLLRKSPLSRPAKFHLSQAFLTYIKLFLNLGLKFIRHNGIFAAEYSYNNSISEARNMNNVVKFLLVLVAIVVVPLVVLLGLYLDLLPQSLQVGIAMFAVFSAIAIIVGGNLYLMWDDIKTGRYKKRT